ncbi:alpha/beta hydrolase [Methylovirgula sp. 4M-Z18]|uniref:alpha/beta hydrolase n=1 Tax=Methylovirgula sp. 4M-Z18 TaxID=2293567 RepID=UPI000E2F29C0|nr:prolyl oligopeptidase family serine peptidase [Methylovirgula sp. 4M-Z18]RFB78563.1 phospholipase [Methylovirgula sp. 4M-Z18]
MAPTLSGPRLPARSGKAKQLVVFLHGYGASGDDLIDIGRQWQGLLPDAAFVAPHAPEPCGMGGGGRQWFALTFRDADERWRGVTQARPTLDAFLNAELAKQNLTDADLCLVGFSQGTMMALHTGLRRNIAPAAIVGYSGQLVGPEHLSEAKARNSKGAPPPVLLVHGDMDEVLTVDNLFLSADALGKADIPCEWHLSLGIGHGIDQGGLVHGGLFIAQRFGVKVQLKAR